MRNEERENDNEQIDFIVNSHREECDFLDENCPSDCSQCSKI